MTDTKRIQATLGPYRGQNLDVDPELADQAIEDGWAIDPFAPPGDPVEFTDEDREAAMEAAEKAAKKLRGEETEEEAEADKAKPKKSRTREMEAGAGKPYTTRSTK